MCPVFSAVSRLFRSALFVLPVSSRTSTGMSFSMALSVRKCCCARISVGAISAAWKPLSRAMSMLSSATRVLPLPTSPCTRRFICRPLPMSFRTSFTTRFCAPVGSKGMWSR